MNSTYGPHAQYARAHRRLAEQVAAAVRDPDVIALPSKVDQVRARTLELRLPAPIADTSLRTGKLVSGRVRLPDDQRTLLGWGPGTELVASPHGPQLVLVEAGPDSDVVGARIQMDSQGRLHLPTGQRQLLGIGSDEHVAMLADAATRNLRLIDPERLLAVLAEVTPLDSDADPCHTGTTDTHPQPGDDRVVAFTRTGERR